MTDFSKFVKFIYLFFFSHSIDLTSFLEQISVIKHFIVEMSSKLTVKFTAFSRIYFADLTSFLEQSDFSFVNSVRVSLLVIRAWKTYGYEWRHFSTHFHRLVSFLIEYIITSIYSSITVCKPFDEIWSTFSCPISQD